MERKIGKWRKKINRISNHIDDILARADAIVAVETSGKPLNEILTELNSSDSAEIQELLRKSKKIDLHFGWLVESIIEMRKELGSIDIKKLIIFKSSGENTYDIFETKIDRMRELIHNRDKGYSCIKKIFNDSTGNGGFSNDSLLLVQEIKSKLSIIDRQLSLMKNRIFNLIFSRTSIVTVLIIAVLSLPVFYLLVSLSTEEPISVGSITELAQTDIEEVAAAVGSEKPLLQRIFGVMETLANIGARIPGVLLLAGFSIAIIRRFFYRENWKHSGLRGVENELFDLAAKFKSSLK